MISAFVVAFIYGLRCRGLAVGWRFFQPVGLDNEISDYLLQVTVLTLELLYLVSGGIPHSVACQPLLPGGTLPERSGSSLPACIYGASLYGRFA